MIESEESAIKLLAEIRELLIPIAAHFEQEYAGTKRKQLEELLSTETKQKIFLLLFNVQNLPQTEIAKLTNTTQPTVSRLITSLLDAELIGKGVDENGKDYYIDKYGLSRKVEIKNGKYAE
jgi:DNA-binding MarR family transcriptional regulator